MATSARPTAQAFRDVIGRFATGVTVVTTHHDGQDHGMTASAVSSLSLQPPMLLACINLASPTGDAIHRSRRFVINVLGEDQAALAERFAQRHDDRYDGVATTRGALGALTLDGALAHIECRVVEDVTAGTHRIFIGEVARAVGREGAPLAYFRGQFGQLHLSRRDPVAGDPVRGYRVAPVTPIAVADALDARCAIELGAAELGVAAATPADLDDLRVLADSTEPPIADPRAADVEAYAVANTAFHEALVGLAGSTTLLHAYRGLSLPGILIRGLREGPLRRALAEDHRTIVRAYATRDVAAARRAIVEHTEHTKAAHAAATPD